jgi:hypothetical protein
VDKKLEKLLINKYPKFFRDMYGDMTKTCMHWGCDVGAGWFGIIDRTCKKIKKIVKSNPQFDFYFLQVKEKFGGLRLYSTGGNLEIGKLIQQAEDESYKTCEECGTKKDVLSEGSWIRTLCSSCRKSLTK